LVSALRCSCRDRLNCRFEYIVGHRWLSAAPATLLYLKDWKGRH
jgi:hypothetical protein